MTRVMRVESVALNAMFLAPGDSGGPETYLRQLARALAAEYPGLRVTLLTTRSGARALAADGFGEFVWLRSLPAEEYRRLRRQFAEQLLVQVHAHRSGADLLHNIAGTGPICSPRLRSVATLHDVTFLHTPTFGRVTTWGMTHAGSLQAHPVAYFCAEFGIHESLPIYSGGLGVLAGDHLKSASDLNVPLVGVGLLYHQGYVDQKLDANMWQQDVVEPFDVADLPVDQARNAKG